MLRALPWGVVFVVLSLLQVSSAQSQPTNPPQTQTSNAETTDSVPRLIRFSGIARDASGAAINGTVTMSFALYDAQTGGQLLWSEKQTVQCNQDGHYTVLLGSTQADGLPMEVFTSRQARWLGVALESEGTEHARVQLTSTPYALKAADADTLGGRPP